MSQEENGYGHTQNPLLIVVSGPSGVGKDAVVQGVRAEMESLHFVVTTTDRPPRDEEVDGVDYHFISTEEFKAKVENDEFFEWAWVYEQLKGVQRKEILGAFKTGKDVIMRVDVQGAETIRQKAPEAILIFLTTDTEEELMQRLRKRDSDTEEQLAVRIETARKEFTKIKDFDYKVVNRDGKLKETVEMIEGIIKAEHHRVKQRKVEI